MVEELSKIGFAKKVYKLEKPNKFATFTRDEPLKIDGMYSVRLDLINK